MTLRAFLLACLFATPALASHVFLVETGDSRSSATDIDLFFTLPPPADVFADPPFPTASVTGDLSTASDVDWISFTGRGGQIVYVDSDQYPLLVDTALYLFSSNGTLLAMADDSIPIDNGSEFELDAFLGVFVLPADGTYYLAITSWSVGPTATSSSTYPLFRPDGGEGGFGVLGAEPGNDVLAGVVEPIDRNEYTVHVTKGAGLCEMELTYDSGTLRIDFAIATPDPATWNVWVNSGTLLAPLWSLSLPEVENRTPVAVPIPNFPSLGRIGFLTTLTDSSGIVCSTWRTVSTTAPFASTAEPRAKPTVRKRRRQGR